MTISRALKVTFVMFLVGAFYVPAAPSHAQSDPSAQECTSSDKKKIRGFNKKVKRKQNEREKLRDNADKYASIGGSMKYRRKIQEINDFFDSPEYHKMRPIYERCDQQMPR